MFLNALTRLFRIQADPRPEELLLNSLKANPIKKFDGFPLNQGVQIPCVRARHALYPFYDEKHPILSKFRQIIDEVDMGSEAVLLDSVNGCAASKTSTSFAYMAQLKWYAEKTRQNKDKVEQLAEQVLNGTDDCVRFCDRNATVYRQAWDGRQWFVNYGGSHRTGAVWLIDKQNGTQRFVESDVKEFRLNEDFKELCKDNSIFLFEAENAASFLDAFYGLKDSDIVMAKNGPFLTSRPNDFCLVVSKANPFYADIRQALAEGFDFSDWVLNPTAYTEYETHYLSNPDLAQSF